MDLEGALLDLAEHLDYPAGNQLVATVRERVSGIDAKAERRNRRSRALLVAAAVFVVILASVIVVAPAREAIADWLGIGAVEVRRGPALPVAPPTTRPRAHSLGDARTAVDFTISTPPAAVAGPLLEVAVDPRVPGGLVALRYRRFTLQELASSPGRAPVIGKVVDPLARVDDVDVDGVRGLWIVGAHEIGYLDRAGRFRTSTIRRSGPVLLWSRGGITYRVEGLASQAEAQAVAASMRSSAR
jgi:hypothetical protein